MAVLTGLCHLTFLQIYVYATISGGEHFPPRLHHLPEPRHHQWMNHAPLRYAFSVHPLNASNIVDMAVLVNGGLWNKKGF